jgi:hypothetical protein
MPILSVKMEKPLRIIVFNMSGLDENTILNNVRRYQGVIP